MNASTARSAPRHARWPARVSSALAALAALLATLAAGSSASTLPSAAEPTLMVEIWRVVGLSTFAALILLLAFRPLSSPTLWVIVIANKLALATSGIALGPKVAGAADAAVWDGVLVVILTAGFASSLLARRRNRAFSEGAPS